MNITELHSLYFMQSEQYLQFRTHAHDAYWHGVMGYAIKVQALGWESQFSHLTFPLPLAPLSFLTQSNYFPCITTLTHKKEEAWLNEMTAV